MHNDQFRNDYTRGSHDSSTGTGGARAGQGYGSGGGRGGYGSNQQGNQQGAYGGSQGGYGGSHERRGMPLSELDPALTEISRKVIGCAIDVHRTLGPGYTIDVYRAALASELQTVGVLGSFAHTLDVTYKGAKIGAVVADLYVEGKFIVTLLNRPGEIGGFERAQLRAQLKSADLDLGLIINFGERRLKDGLVRVLNIEKLNAEREDEYEDDDSGEHGQAQGHAPEQSAGGGTPGNTVSFS